MINIWYLFYNIIVIPFLFVMLNLFGLFNKKIKTGIRDRRKLFENLIINLQGLNRRKKMVWFHQSSMGEFEQAKPIISRLYETGKVNIIITFFSPSGYENSKNYPYAHIISYIPFDTPYFANRFLTIVKPHLAVFMRYDIWPNFIWQLNNKKVPAFVVDATMRFDSKRKLPVAKNFHHKLFNDLTSILAVSKDDVENFRAFGLNKVNLKAVGDTRFDRVFEKSKSAKARKLLSEDFFNGKKVIVAGSSWEADENVFLPAFLKLAQKDPDVLLIIVPHEPTVMHLEKLENFLTNQMDSIRFSYLAQNYKGERIIIVDSIGILLTLYYYADIAYVGGSFKQGVHNVLEPAVYGIPVIYGPKHTTSREAKQMLELGNGIMVKNKRDVYRALRRLTSNEEERARLGSISRKFIEDNLGATEEILAEINKFI